MSKIATILWMDLEMTGLSPADDHVLEIAAIATDWNFNEIATYESLIKNSSTQISKRIKANSIFWDANPNTRDELLKQNNFGKSLKTVERELISFINKNFKNNTPVLLGGNSVHVDRRFIIEKWPSLDAKLHYRMLDVSAWKVVFEGKYKKKFAKPNNHRALEDIRGSILELQYYLNHLRP